MLLHVLNVEAQPDIETDRWEEQLTASGAGNASGVVDIKHFVAFCLQGGIEGAETVLGALSRAQQENERLAGPSEPSNEMLAAINTHPARNPDRSLTLSSLRTAVIGDQPPLPLPKDQAGALVVVDSKTYVLRERLGSGAGGSVFAASLKCEAADVHAAGDDESHDPDSMALKLAGGVGDAERRGADTRLGFVAVEAVAAAE
eukprot:1352139-Amphidinium_carterae.1